MAFDLRGLQPMGANARGGQIGVTTPGDNSMACWIYSTADDVGSVVAGGYFNQVRDIVNKFDAILIASGTKNLRWTQFTNTPRSPSTGNVIVSGKDLDAS